MAPVIAICVGATKAGTSWLYEQLATHPECHFRTIKELHYFDAMTHGWAEEQIAAHRADLERFRGWLTQVPDEQVARIEQRITDVTAWIAVLERGGIDPAAYLDFLQDGRGQRTVVGEVTPAYSKLNLKVLRRIAEMAADVRIIYLMRDPVARMWSHVRMLAQREAGGLARFDKRAESVFDAVVASDPLVQHRGDYAKALDKLSQAVAPGKLLVLFSEEMMTQGGMRRIWDFLGVTPVPGAYDRRVHEGEALAMSPDQRARARAALLPQYRAVARRFAVLPEAWVRSMEEVAA